MSCHLSLISSTYRVLLSHGCISVSSSLQWASVSFPPLAVTDRVLGTLPVGQMGTVPIPVCTQPAAWRAVPVPPALANTVCLGLGLFLVFSPQAVGSAREAAGMSREGLAPGWHGTVPRSGCLTSGVGGASGREAGDPAPAVTRSRSGLRSGHELDAPVDPGPEF